MCKNDSILVINELKAALLNNFMLRLGKLTVSVILKDVSYSHERTENYHLALQFLSDLWNI